ncbi:hypothetical protein yc1106_04359 [Curvularia clavata]|uniref:G domain-containing protein n=1 Tax=Curvularia clavata TaxID=95742 RepID=A0A9Q8Z7H5_CURCL|nr:hypothetical protein yc1106_04359 [Curvularia clavata]
MSSPWSTNANEVVIGVVGVTGSGKSSFIKRVTQCSDILTSTDTESLTQEIAQYRFQSAGITYVLVDTPGFDDSQRDDEDVYRELARWMAQAFQKGQLLNGLLYLQAVNIPRQRGSQIRNLLMFKKLCGNNNFKNIVLGLSFCDMETETTIQSRRQELTDTWEWWGEMVSKGSRIERIPYQRDECIGLLAQFAPQPKVTLRVQEEIVNHGRSVDDTEAAKTIVHREELMQIRAAEARQFANLQAEYEQKMQRAKEVYAITLKLAQQQFEIQQQRLEIQHQRLQLREQSFSQSFKRQEVLDQKVKALRTSNAAQKEANRRELAILHEQLLQINLRNDRDDSEAAYAKAQPGIFERKSRVFAEWKFVKSRKFAFRMKQPYKEYAVDGVSAEDTMGAFLTSFCDHCLKSYSASEDYSNEGKGCFFHGQSDLRVAPKLKQAFYALKDCPRYNVDRMIDLTCDNCSRDMLEDSLYLRKFGQQRKTTPAY